mmetsp:Transcript_35059/g.54782  ORF Transcript_35059/g.54782 Transcript_35059/m.54782 type:complete len:84 (+) Transcript_35059:242-493(+)
MGWKRDINRMLRFTENFAMGPGTAASYMLVFLVGLLIGIFGTVICFMRNPRVARSYVRRIKAIIAEEKKLEEQKIAAEDKKKS